MKNILKTISDVVESNKKNVSPVKNGSLHHHTLHVDENDANINNLPSVKDPVKEILYDAIGQWISNNQEIVRDIIHQCISENKIEIDQGIKTQVKMMFDKMLSQD